MPAQSLENRIYLIVAELFDVRPDALTPASSPKTIEQWDSTGHLNLVLALEEEFGVKFSPDQMDQMADLETIVGMVADMKPVHVPR
ncbi:MAG TPA: acyl carrier protein [Candidatus Eremiobacteraceae bacterium]|nr:acyl carrier protein [Candidatus Eremiobacteraceae bacterium]